ncbi:Hypothetical protein Cul05146_0033 [Corynebacterium ulcerans]|nr:Hypothetical protein Cul05146_0033 [Corynebacterium ulcerans]
MGFIREKIENLFSAYAEVVPLWPCGTGIRIPFLRVCGGSSITYIKSVGSYPFSPRMRR